MSLSLYFFQLEICNRCVLCSALVCTLQLHLSNASSSLYTISEHRSSLSNGCLLTHIHVEDLLCMTFRVYENFGAVEVQDISNRVKYLSCWPKVAQKTWTSSWREFKIVLPRPGNALEVLLSCKRLQGPLIGLSDWPNLSASANKSASEHERCCTCVIVWYHWVWCESYLLDSSPPNGMT